jgi:hypothetical protein
VSPDLLPSPKKVFRDSWCFVRFVAANCFQPLESHELLTNDRRMVATFVSSSCNVLTWDRRVVPRRYPSPTPIV